MAGQVIAVELKVNDSSRSMATRTKEAKALNAELEKMPKYSRAARDPSESVEYGRARGSMGATGASARDFANQAQGLGGIVRLYATWAANIFAVSAAFNALSEAANTTNMITGMNQLSAATGVAMGSMAKKFAEASGGAISLREAMEATTKAVSSGLSQEQFDKLGEVATKASRALGVGMSDAVSRLTRGITKLEPELLDELGIFTKVGTASEAYAKSIGKSALALTDFEKRQAFANAVLDEGLTKFGEIDVAANPYDQLAASLRNLTQSSLEVVNKVLGPLVGFLSTSPTALTGAVAALSLMLLKQAVPAIGEYRQGLQRAAEEAQEIATMKTKSAAAASAAAVKNALTGVDNMAQEAADRAAAKLDILETIVNSNQKKYGATVRSILAEDDLTKISENQIRTIENFSKSNTRLSGVYKSLAEAIREAKLASEEYEKQKTIALANQSKKDASILSDVRRAEREAKAARSAAQGREIISRASQDVGTEGISGAFKNLRENVQAAPDMGPIRKGFTTVAGAASIATSAITRVLGAFSSFTMYIGIAVAAFSLLNGVFSANSAEMSKFTTSLDYAKETTKTATDTAERFKDVLSADSIIAFANATDGVSNSMRNLIKDLRSVDLKANFWDRQIDAIKDLFGYGLKDTFRDSMAEQVTEGLKVISDPKTKQIAEDQIKKLLSIKNVNFETVQDAIDNLDPQQALKMGDALQEVFKNASIQGLAAKSAIEALRNATKETEESFQSLSNQLKSNDPIVNFASSIIKQGILMEESFKDPQVALVSMREIMQDISKIKLYPPEAASALLAARDQFTDLTQQIKNAEKRQTELNAQVAKLKIRPFGERTDAGNERRRNLGRAESESRSNQATLDRLRQDQQRMTSELGKTIPNSIKYGFELIAKQSGIEAAKADVNRSKALLGGIRQTPETIRAQLALDNQLVDLEIEQVNLMATLVNQGKIAEQQRKQAMLQNKIDKMSDNKSNMDVTDLRELARLEKEMAQLGITIESLGRKNGGVTSAVRSGKLSLTDEVREMMIQESGVSSKIISLLSKKQQQEIAAEFKVLENQYAEARKNKETDLSEIVRKQQQFRAGPEFEKMGTLERAAKEEEFTRETESLRRDIALIGANLEIAKAQFAVSSLSKGKDPKSAEAAKDSLRAAEQDKKVAEEKFNKDEADKRAADSREASRKSELELQDKAIANRQAEIALADAKASSYTTMSGVLRDEQAVLLETGKITSEQYEAFIKESDQKELQAQKQNALLKEDLELRRKIAELEKKKIGASSDTIASVNTEIENEQRLSDLRRNSLNFYYDKKQKILDLEQSITNRQKAYGDIFKQTFEGMADALAEFARTGKLDFKSLIDSMLTDLLRYEMRLQYSKLFESMGGKGGITGFLTNMLTGMIGGAMAPTSGGVNYSLSSGSSSLGSGLTAGSSLSGLKVGTFANGGSFDQGIQAFAKGGTFTNSVVSSPTLFKFAQGTGLMGEAGPEAIMPLKRDNSGNLGVRAQAPQSNVTVTVINNSSEKAETRETTDSRGNRNVEVVIGEMVAGEMARPNSALQNTMKNTYGNTPVLIRR